MTGSSPATPSALERADRLFRHDRLIVWNTTRATFARWHDRAIAALLLLMALGAVRTGVADRPWTVAAWAALAAGTAIGIGAGRLVAQRLAFHACDGLLAAEALHPRTRRRYAAAWHGVGLMLLAAVTLVARPAMLIVSVPAYLAGVLLAGLADGVRLPGLGVGRSRPGWMVRATLHRPVAGVAAATMLLVSLSPIRILGMNALMAVIGIAAVLLALALTAVDDAVVRFMSIAGHGPARIVGHHVPGLAAFLILAVPGCAILFAPVAAGIVAAVGAAMLLLLTLRILAYRLHARRFADLLVAILAAIVLLVAYAMPVALPVIVLAIVWPLQRRARAKTWLLA